MNPPDRAATRPCARKSGRLVEARLFLSSRLFHS
ncbi:BQ5605_C009g05474 [Microbotryum silenes-dioicae]|uniref:BQ5605_C009g05473 protein n=1 Tax=Microbotryum silenes-dioicae TaxID=796604 RepID=A0A2X0MGJ7_9BASI|nr:BQ5605_C009g05473 [Microbotryum silenes-dioicae]SGY81156.1 BQ5605_C009g05474 [Microbotryum silenes-dioicae]